MFKPGGIYRYVQIAFVAVYVVAGFLLLTNPAFGERLSQPQRIGIGAVLLAYAGYRSFVIYKQFAERRDDDLP